VKATRVLLLSPVTSTAQAKRKAQTFQQDEVGDGETCQEKPARSGKYLPGEGEWRGEKQTSEFLIFTVCG